MSRDRSILIAALVTVVCAGVLLLASPALGWLRVIAGVPLVLLLPGHAVMLYVDSDGRLGLSEWFVLAIGTSMSVSMLLGLGVASSIGLSATAMVTALAAVTLLALLAASLRQRSEPQRRGLPARRNSGRRLVLGVLALLACVLAIQLLSIPWGASAASDQTIQLWGLPNQTDGGLRIGATNIDATPQHYRLTIQQQGQLISQQDFDMPAGKSRLFIVKKSALLTQSSPVVGVLTDTSGVVAKRTISVWTSQ